MSNYNYQRYPKNFDGWQNCNPGAGGQIQHVSCNPDIPGRFYLCSDMEGWYVTDDYGDNWQYKGRYAPTANTFRVEAEPGNPDRLYLGHPHGLSISDDGGETWRDVPELADILIATIAIDPKNPNTIFAGNSWLEDVSEVTRVQGGTDGARLIYFSHDRGETWQAVQYEAEEGDRHLFTVSFHPQNEGEVVIGGVAGLYKSLDNGHSWNPVPLPANNTECRGADFTPDGRFLYAVYVDDKGKTAVVAQSYSDGEWQVLGLGELAKSPTTHWNPRISEYSTADEHWFLLGPLPTPNEGLYEGHYKLKDDRLQGSIRKTFDAPAEINEANPDSPFRIDYGWNRYHSMARTYVYYPKKWENGRRVLTMSQQQVFRGNPDEPYTSWHCITSHPVWELDGVRFHRHNGTASTYTYDMTGIGSYVLQGQGDNGTIESYDGGYSWTEDMRPGEPTGKFLSNVEGVGVVPLDPPIVLAGGLGDCWGGGHIESNCELWFKRLDVVKKGISRRGAETQRNREEKSAQSAQSADKKEYIIRNTPWELLAHGDAGSATQHGLPNKRIHVVTSDPHRPERVYMGTQAGIYLIEDIVVLVERGEGEFRLISEDGPGLASIRELVVDAQDPNVIYVMGGIRENGLGKKGVWRGDRDEAGDYTWIQIYPEGCTGNGLGDFAAWHHDGVTYLVGAFELYNGKPWHGDTEMKLSVDGGKTWRLVLDLDAAFAIVPPGDWYDRDTMEIQFGGLVGFEDKLYCTVHSRRIQQTVAFLRGTISPDGTVIWEDWTGEGNGRFWFTYSRRGKVWPDENGVNYIYQSTMGAGMWRRKI